MPANSLAWPDKLSEINFANAMPFLKLFYYYNEFSNLDA